MSLRAYPEYLEEADNRRQWIINQIDNTERTHEAIKAEFLKKYPGQGKFFERVVSSIVD